VQNLIELRRLNEVKVSIGSHTDSKASKAYHVRLSNRPANSTLEYLVKNGIETSRLSALRLGKTMLTNGGSDAVRCIEEDYQQTEEDWNLLKSIEGTLGANVLKEGLGPLFMFRNSRPNLI